eukprot:CAMPEP_0195101218 /NCGR_PEP_ID=MMETSP0448-20130528/64978_1 /TAXON_ID=66468 /ORGANISM="Heterocapsa triquestra, Strain CCMP 448" /LENGTH=179 /DNA_ID=CAMNT_0040136487 /DNA_START=98 /DNA_END=637 /DNA_ORIENTATION=+
MTLRTILEGTKLPRESASGVESLFTCDEKDPIEDPQDQDEITGYLRNALAAYQRQAANLLMRLDKASAKSDSLRAENAMITEAFQQACLQQQMRGHVSPSPSEVPFPVHLMKMSRTDTEETAPVSARRDEQQLQRQLTQQQSRTQQLHVQQQHHFNFDDHDCHFQNQLLRHFQRQEVGN